MKQLTKQFPQKTTINLVIKERTANSPSRAIPVFLIVLALIAVFCKFAVIDRLKAVDQKAQELAQIQRQIAELERETAGFDEVSKEYSRYSASKMTEDEKAAVDRMEALSLIENDLMAAARVSRFSIAGNTLAVELSGVTLEQTSSIVQRLKESDLVSNVTVYTADTKESEGNGVAVSMTITLEQPVEGGDQE